MPDIVTHYLFGKEVLKKLPNSLQQQIKGFDVQYNIGTQGPDPFFYYSFQPWKKSDGINNFGNYMHDNNTGQFLQKLFKYIKNTESKASLAYALGFICHFSLDTTAHPYIYYVTGEYDKNDENTFSYRGNHLRLERAIDSLFIKKHLNANPNKFRIDREIYKNESLNEDVEAMLNDVLKDVYNKNQYGSILKNGVDDMKRFLKLVRSRTGFKKTLAKFVDKHFNKTGSLVYESVFYYKNIDNNIDYLNVAKKQWSHPFDLNEKYNDSFEELFLKAQNKAIKLIEIISNYLESNIDDIEFEKVLEDISYSSGRSCSEDKTMKYFDPIL